MDLNPSNEESMDKRRKREVVSYPPHKPIRFVAMSLSESYSYLLDDGFDVVIKNDAPEELRGLHIVINARRERWRMFSHDGETAGGHNFDSIISIEPGWIATVVTSPKTLELMEEEFRKHAGTSAG